MAGAAAAVTCQIKPMQIGDVTPYNDALSEYLQAQRCEFGCSTQIRLGFLKPDGYHVKPQYDLIIDRTYSCAIRCICVADPTPPDKFIPDHVRRSWQREWPRLGGGARSGTDYGW